MLNKKLRFYEALSLILQTYPNGLKAEQLIDKLMEKINFEWDTIRHEIQIKREALREEIKLDQIKNILKTNLAICVSLRSKFKLQMDKIFSTMIEIYQGCTELIHQIIDEETRRGISVKIIIKYSEIQQIRGVKQLIVGLISAFGESCEPSSRSFILPIIENFTIILQDYGKISPDLRDFEVISCLTIMIIKLDYLSQPFIRVVYDCIFEVTLGMIINNTEEYPEHRLALFRMMHAIVSSSFIFLKEMPLDQVIGSFFLAIRHTERNVAQIGLQILWLILRKLSGEKDFSIIFYKQFFRDIIHDLFVVMTDTFHKSDFKMHARILHHLLHSVLKSGNIDAPLRHERNEVIQSAKSSLNDIDHFKKYLISLFSRDFPMVKTQQIEISVEKIFYMEDFDNFAKSLKDMVLQTQNNL